MAKEPSARAPLVEVFWSIQGEGRFVGETMGFLRVATCPLRCSYCDTPNSYTAEPTFLVHAAGGSSREPNPVGAARAADLARSSRPATHRATPRLSITGGEPLVFPSFVSAIGATLRAEGWRIHLETAAIDSAAFLACADQVDHLSADWKLPETIDGADHGDSHFACCETALAHGATVDVKIVLTPAFADASLVRALERLAPLRERILLILQPVTPALREQEPLPASRLIAAIALAEQRGFITRTLPQAHKMLRVP